MPRPYATTFSSSATDAAALHLLGCARIRDAAGLHAELARTPTRVHDGAGLRAEPARPFVSARPPALMRPPRASATPPPIRDTTRVSAHGRADPPRRASAYSPARRSRGRDSAAVARSLRPFARKAATAPPSRGASGRSATTPPSFRASGRSPARPRPLCPRVRDTTARRPRPSSAAASECSFTQLGAFWSFDVMFSHLPNCR
ncbi:hypothetical protein PVAP13_5NG452580 [Panicum virgatum]|uniref:Uncharacterized protein n=1 Tax=Panicum virgatum TaxID=38727 RepID=A0A8T0S339_PANVG|nr:hypothetical protein PVAP13_5NG452580 [Panicum virgatum]